MRFHDTLAVFVAESEQAFLLNGHPDEWIDVRIDFGAMDLPLHAYLLARLYPAWRPIRSGAGLAPGPLGPLRNRSAEDLSGTGASRRWIRLTDVAVGPDHIWKGGSEWVGAMALSAGTP